MSPESGVDTSWNRETRDLYARLIEAWDKRNARDYALQFTSDASLVGFDGTQVNGQHVTSAVLADGDEIHFGNVMMRFVLT